MVKHMNNKFYNNGELQDGEIVMALSGVTDKKQFEKEFLLQLGEVEQEESLSKKLKEAVKMTNNKEFLANEYGVDIGYIIIK